MHIACISTDHDLSAAVVPLAELAAERLDLTRWLARINLCLDDIALDERIWFSLSRQGAQNADHRLVLTLYLHPDLLRKDRPSTISLLPRIPVWEHADSPLPEAPSDATPFSRAKAERFLYHHLLFSRDLCDGSLDALRIPARLVEAAQAAWSVTVDGRLRRDLMPGYSAAERRRQFLRIFSAAGIILPEHWRFFHELWEAEGVDQARLIDIAARLPRLVKGTASGI